MQINKITQISAQKVNFGWNSWGNSTLTKEQREAIKQKIALPPKKLGAQISSDIAQTAPKIKPSQTKYYLTKIAMFLSDLGKSIGLR